MNETCARLKNFAQECLQDSCNKNGQDIRFWIGCLEGLNAMYKAYRREIDRAEAEE